MIRFSGAALRAARMAAGWTQESLCRRLKRHGLEILPRTLRRYEAGECEPRVSRALQISQALGVPLEDLTQTTP